MVDSEDKPNFTFYLLSIKTYWKALTIPGNVNIHNQDLKSVCVHSSIKAN